MSIATMNPLHPYVPQEAPMIQVQSLHFSYPEQSFCFDLQVQAGERIVLTGESGAGKSTLLHLLAGFLIPQSGTIYLNGQEMTSIPVHQRPITMLFQQHNLFEHLTVYQNIALGLAPNAKLDTTQQAMVQEWLQHVGLEGLLQREVHTLSGGQQQRVALARTFLRQQPIILLDEPFSSLDAPRRQEMLQLLDQLLAQSGRTLLMVSHHPDECQSLMTRRIHLEQGQLRTLSTEDA